MSAPKVFTIKEGESDLKKFNEIQQFDDCKAHPFAADF